MHARSPNSPAPLALLSVTDKTGLVDFARGLIEVGFQLLSTGGTAKLLRDAAVPVTDVAEFTGSPEILNGRVKTLHPKIHGGILLDRADPLQLAEAHAHGIRPIDVVVVNLYQFREQAVARQLDAQAAIEHIDIGGPTMLRAAAKNWLHTTVVVDPSDYAPVLTALRQGPLAAERRRALAAKVFAAVSSYDAMIAEFLAASTVPTVPTVSGANPFPDQAVQPLRKVMDLRYGENPHQQAALYADSRVEASGFAAMEFLAGKELSYNNILDLDAAIALAAEFKTAAAVVVKHTNPCGVATSGTQEMGMAALFQRALACDPKSAFGGIVALNRPLDADAAMAITSIFTECVAAPAFSPEALAILARKPQLRVVRAPYLQPQADSVTPSSSGPSLAALHIRSVRGGLLIQTPDISRKSPQDWQAVTRLQPTPALLDDMVFAALVAKHVKSNAIVFARNGVTLGIGAGQMSRIDAANIAVAKAAESGSDLRGSVLASDAFFPFRDTVDFAAAKGVAAVVQPGGSKRDQDSVTAADEHGLVMMFSGERHFRH